MTSRVTMLDIAYKLSISQSTVSRALRDDPLISKLTRQQVARVACEIGYRINKSARALRRQQSDTIALLIFEDSTQPDSGITPFFDEVIFHIAKASKEQGYDLMIAFQEVNTDWEMEYIHAGRADGLILLGYDRFSQYEQKLAVLKGANVPFVVWGNCSEQFSGVATNNYLAGGLVARHLADKQRKNVLFIGSVTNDYPEFRDRYLGLIGRQELFNNIAQLDAISSVESGRMVALTNIELIADVDTIVCASDLLAIGVRQALTVQNTRVPEQVSLVGFDDLPQARRCLPSLTTVKQNTQQAGESLVKSLLTELFNGRPTQTRLTPTLVIRESA